MRKDVMLVPTYDFAVTDPTYNDGVDYIDGVRTGIYRLAEELGLTVLVVHTGNIEAIFEMIHNQQIRVKIVKGPGGHNIGKHPDRDEVDFALYKLAYILNIMAFGICRGMQVLAVLLNGKLIEKLTTTEQYLAGLGEFPHGYKEHLYELLQINYHEIVIHKGTELYMWLLTYQSEYKENEFVRYEKVNGCTVVYMQVNSMHEQAIDWATLPASVKQHMTILGSADVPEIIQIQTNLLTLDDFRKTQYDELLEKFEAFSGDKPMWYGSQDHVEAYPAHHPLRQFVLWKLSQTIK